MFEILEKIRHKPDIAKKKIAFLTAFSFAGVIFVVWLSVIYPDLKRGNQNDNVSESSDPTPLSALTENISAGFSTITGEFGEIQNMIGGFKENPDGSTAATSSASIDTNIYNSTEVSTTTAN